MLNRIEKKERRKRLDEEIEKKNALRKDKN